MAQRQPTLHQVINFSGTNSELAERLDDLVARGATIVSVLLVTDHVDGRNSIYRIVIRNADEAM